MKHVEIDFHSVRDYVRHQLIQLQHISSRDQPADILTKPLPVSHFIQQRTKLMVNSLPVPLKGGDKPTDILSKLS